MIKTFALLLSPLVSMLLVSWLGVEVMVGWFGIALLTLLSSSGPMAPDTASVGVLPTETAM